MSEIRVKENESLESALRRFKRSCAKEGVIAEVKKREHYVSPSLKRKQKSESLMKTVKTALGNQSGFCVLPFQKSCLLRFLKIARGSFLQCYIFSGAEKPRMWMQVSRMFLAKPSRAMCPAFRVASASLRTGVSW